MDQYWLYRSIDVAFIVFHVVLIIFNLVGWIWQASRKWHLISVMLILLSWFGLGIFYGWGYCFITEWHWDVRRKIEPEISSNSYIHFLILETTGIDLPESLVDQITFILFFVILFIALFMNIRDFLKTRRQV